MYRRICYLRVVIWMSGSTKHFSISYSKEIETDQYVDVTHIYIIIIIYMYNYNYNYIIIIIIIYIYTFSYRFSIQD